MKIKAEVFAEQLRKANGLPKATQIAKGFAKNKDGWKNVPSGPVFFHKDKRGQERVDEKYWRGIHGFWTQVAGILRKKTK